MPGNAELFPHGGKYPNRPDWHGIAGLPTGVGQLVNHITWTKPLSCPAGSRWVPVTEAMLSPYSISQVVNLLTKEVSSGFSAPASDGWVYFTISGTSGVQFRGAIGSGSTYGIQCCVASAVPVAVGGTATVGVAFSMTGVPTVRYSANPLGSAFFALPLPPNAPPPGVPTFVTAPGLGQFSWVLVTSVAGQHPNAPPPGAALPGVWALVRPHFWMWYPSPPRTLAVVNTYFVFTNSNQLLGIPNPGLPRPTAPPPQVAGTAAANGQWINSGPGYWAWAPMTAMTAAAPATSYTWLWVLLGLGVVGGGAYYLLD